jgi:DNA-binding response OmpR family regulator
MTKALVVDDDFALADVISFALRRVGYEIVLAHDGIAALECWENEAPDIIILDLNLPRLDGFGVCQRIRAKAKTPIIILSVRDKEDDIVEGLQLGADDYMTKPFSPRQMIARVEAVLRRSTANQPAPQPIDCGCLKLDPARHEVYRKEKCVAKLTQLECRLLEVLMINHNQVLLADMLIDQVWGPAGGDRSMLKQLIYRLRQKIEVDPSTPEFIGTIPGAGYLINCGNGKK